MQRRNEKLDEAKSTRWQSTPARKLGRSWLIVVEPDSERVQGTSSAGGDACPTVSSRRRTCRRPPYALHHTAARDADQGAGVGHVVNVKSIGYLTLFVVKFLVHEIKASVKRSRYRREGTMR